MIGTTENTVGIGPWSWEVGPVAVVILVIVVGIVVYQVRKDD